MARGPLKRWLAAETTIVAQATPEGSGGLAVIRLSGPQAVAIARRIFDHPDFQRGCQSHRAYHGLVVQPSVPGREGGAAGGPAPSALDEVLALPLLAPRSYTGEDTVEFFCHGGRLPARRVLAACLAAGAEAAGPGEFTRRAFLNGKLSLTQAEAVADLIGAEDELAAGAALAQLRGALDRELQEIETPLRALLADIEGSLEFLEEEGVGVEPQRIALALEGADKKLKALLASAGPARRLREGVQVALTGPPNVGKSSLLNALTGQERAIVDDQAGTTRDVVAARVHRAGCLFVLHDTAGLREGGGRIERIGMERTRQAIADADVVLELREVSGPGNGAIEWGGEPAGPAGGAGSADQAGRGGVEQQVVLRVWTKADRLPEVQSAHRGGMAEDLFTSAVTGEGIERLWGALLAAAGRESLQEVARAGYFLNQRHLARLVRCAERVRTLRDELSTGWPGEEVVAAILGAMLAELGEITGRIFSERLLDDVFSRFCVGK